MTKTWLLCIGPMVCLLSQNALADCSADAKKLHEDAYHDVTGCYVPADGQAHDVRDGAKGCAVLSDVYYFEDGGAAMSAARHWNADVGPLTAVSGSCPQGHFVVRSPAARHEPLVPTTVEDILKSPMPPERVELAGASLLGTAVAAEAAQILGQIVVDRATQAAYEQVRKKIRQGLKCDDAPAEGPTFPATCSALDALRIQDVAMGREVMVRALLTDGVAYGLTKLSGAEHQKTEEAKKAVRWLRSTLPALVAALGDPARVRQNDAARALVDEVHALALRESKNGSRVEQWQPFVVAAAALVACRSQGNLDTYGLSVCVDRLLPSEDNAVARTVARSIARNLLVALTASEGLGEERVPVPRARLSAAIDALCDGICHAIGASSETFVCAGLAGDAAHPVVQLREVLQAAVAGDTNRLIASLSASMPMAGDASPAQRRALRLMGGLLQYADTYTAKGGATSAEQKHEQRTKILESLTADMTQRTGREGDDIFSFGGSLSLLGGVRVGSAHSVAHGPVSLSLGMGFQQVPEGDGPGLHIELGIFDLGQYLSFQEQKEAGTEEGQDPDKTLAVKTPHLQDGISPSLRVGAQWGRDVPFFAGFMVGWSPFYEFTKGEPSRYGSFNAGIVLGAYVPLFDLN